MKNKSIKKSECVSCVISAKKKKKNESRVFFPSRDEE